MALRVKVCGMTIPSQVEELDNIGVDMAGFIFYPGSSRYVGEKISPSEMKKIGGKIGKVGVFVNATYEEIMRIVDSYRLDMVQLHGDESPVFCEKVANYISVIKAFRMSDNDPIDWIMAPYKDHCDMFMFDTLGSGYGGTGKKFNWDVLIGSNPDKLFFLSGGIEEGDEKKLNEFVKKPVADKLFAIDINSRFETQPGIKDIGKIKNLLTGLGSIR